MSRCIQVCGYLDTTLKKTISGVDSHFEYHQKWKWSLHSRNDNILRSLIQNKKLTVDGRVSVCYHQQTEGALDEAALNVVFQAELRLQDGFLFLHQPQGLRRRGQQEL